MPLDPRIQAVVEKDFIALEEYVKKTIPSSFNELIASHCLFLELFFVYSERDDLIHKVLSNYIPNDNVKLLPLKAALELCEHAVGYSSLADKTSLNDAREFFVDLKKNLLPFAAKDLKSCVRKRAMHLLLFFQNLLMDVSKELSLFDNIYDELPGDIHVSPSGFNDLVFQITDVSSRKEVYRIIDMAMCLVFNANKVLLKCVIEVGPIARNTFFMFYFYSDFAEDMHQRLENIFHNGLPQSHTQITSRHINHFGNVYGSLGEILALKTTYKNINNEFEKPLSDLDVERLSNAVFSNSFLAILDDDVLMKFKESGEKLPEEVAQTVDLFYRLIQRLIEACRSLTETEKGFHVDSRLREFARRFLLIPAVFNRLPVPSQKSLLTYSLISITTLHRQAKEFYAQMRTKAAVKTPELKMALKSIDDIFDPFITFNKRGDKLDQETREYYCLINEEYACLRKTESSISMAENHIENFPALYKKLFEPFCQYLESIVDCCQNTSTLRYALTFYKNSDQVIQRHLDLFFQLSEGAISQQEFINSILDAKNSSSLRSTLTSVLTGPKKSVGLYDLFFKAETKVDSPEQFVQSTYDPLSEMERNRDFFRGIDFSALMQPKKLSSQSAENPPQSEIDISQIVKMFTN